MKKLFLLVFILVLGFSVSTNAQYYYNRAFSFSGVAGDYVATDPGSSLSITGDLTVECWVKPTVVTGTPILIQKRLGSSATGYTLYLSSSKVAFRTNSSTRINGKSALVANEWTHIAVTYNSSSGLFSIYLNGVLDTSKTVASAAPAADTDSLRMANGFNGPYSGLLDDVRIWNVERTIGQIQATMRTPLGESTGSYNGLVASWRANNIAGGSGVEEINGYTAYLRGPATYVLYGDKPGGPIAYNTGINFSGVTGTYIAAPHTSALDITGSFTLECWVNPTNVASPSFQILIQKRNGSAAAGYTLYLSTGKVCVRTNSSSRLTGATVIPNGVWSHVAATYNNSTNVFTVYVNGVPDGTITTASAAPASDSDSLRIAAGFNSPYAGLMDEVRISNYAKTTDELQKYMFVSLDSNNKPGASNKNITYSFEGTLNGTDGSSRGTFRGDAAFTRVYTSSVEPPSPLDRYDAGYFASGYRTKYSNLAFGTSPTTISDSVYISQSTTITDVNVFVAANHTFANDINVSIRNPSGSTTRTLYPGGATNVGRHLITIFDDQADSSAVLAPFSPRVKPNATLSPFNGQSSLGWWKITIVDIYPASDNGVLIGWGIQFNNQVITGTGNTTMVPGRFYLHQNYPNPFNPVTTIKYEVAKDINVKIMVYDILCKEIKQLVNENKKAGTYTVELDASNLATGVYFYRINAGDYTDVKKMILIK